VIFDEMTTKDLEYFINLIDKAEAGFGRTDSNFDISSITCCRENFREKNSQSFRQTLLSSYFKNLPYPPQPSATTILIRQHPSTSKQDFPSENDYDSLEAQMVVSNF
jgi:hypothetical protein